MTEPLEKLIARRGGMSRRLAGQAIRRGRVSVDGAEARRPRERVDPGSLITLDGVSLARVPPLVVWHKPTGVLCTLADPLERRTLWAEVPELLHGGLRPVGRLDADTSGLLLFTGDGALTQRLLHPKRGVPRTYLAAVSPAPGPALVQALADGVQTAAGVFTAESVSVEDSLVWLTVRQGKHRMVRRMLNNAGHPVQSLRRIAFGPFRLEDLPSGSHREPTDEEQDWLRINAGVEPAPPTDE